MRRAALALLLATAAAAAPASRRALRAAPAPDPPAAFACPAGVAVVTAVDGDGGLLGGSLALQDGGGGAPRRVALGAGQGAAFYAVAGAGDAVPASIETGQPSPTVNVTLAAGPLAWLVSGPGAADAAGVRPPVPAGTSALPDAVAIENTPCDLVHAVGRCAAGSVDGCVGWFCCGAVEQVDNTPPPLRASPPSTHRTISIAVSAGSAALGFVLLLITLDALARRRARAAAAVRAARAAAATAALATALKSAPPKPVVIDILTPASTARTTTMAPATLSPASRPPAAAFAVDAPTPLPPFTSPPPGSAPPGPLVLDVDPADIVLGRPLGSGSFGLVHEATWRGAPCAVKTLLGADAASLASLAAEVAALAGRRHPRLVTLLGACLDPARGPCLVVELVPGGSLAARLASIRRAGPGGGLSYATTLRVGADVAAGLAALHPAVVHRDVKPSNVLCAAGGRFKLCDFGVARVKAAVGDRTAATADGAMAGTAPFAAPEQFAGGRVTGAADVWGLACVLVHAWTGVAPWAGATSVEVCYSVGVLARPPPQAGGVEGGAPPPPFLARTLSACFARDPAARPTAADLAAALEAELGKVALAAARRSAACSKHDADSTPDGAPATVAAAVSGGVVKAARGKGA